MVDRLAESHFLAVLGASGSGKSSLVHTGLLDALQLGLYVAAGPEWVIADCHPGGTAIRNLAAALLMADGGGTTSLATDALETFLRRGPRAIAEWANDGNLPPAKNLLILVDQFEELFRYSDYAGREEAEAFSTLLLESVRTHRRIHIVITMRSEYLGACSLIPGLAEQINTSMYLTRRMTREECREAIEGPAGVIGFDIEPGLVTRLLNDLSALAPWETDREHSQLQRLSRQADQLPLMQHALSRLWQLAQRRPQRGRVVLTLQDYLDIGQLAGALDQHASEVTMQLSEEAKSAVRLVFRSLVSGTSLADAVRKPMRFADLRDAAGADSAAVREVVDAFRARDCNFLRPGQEVPLVDDTIVDISHESLIRQWDRLAEWFQEEARSSAVWSRLLSDQERYAAGQGELLRGLELANALAWWESERPTEGWALAHGGKFREIENYLRAGREANERQEQQELQRLARERRGLRTRAAIYASLALVGLALAVWASYSRDSAREALAAKEAADERALAATDRFVVGMAHRLLITPGISTEEVETQLSEGKKYLDEFVSHTTQSRQIALIQAKYALTTAQIYQDRGEFERSIESATEMRQFLISGLGTAVLTPEERVQLLEAGNMIARDLYDMKKFPESLAEAKRLVAEADGMSGGPEVLLEKAKVYISLAIALSASGDHMDAHNRADAALTLLRQPGLPETTEVRDYRARCYTTLAVADWNLGKREEAETEEVLSEQAFSAIPLDMKTVPMLLAHSQALSNLALLRSKHQDLQGARELYELSERILRGSELDIRQRIGLRRALVGRRNSLGWVYEQLGDKTTAAEWYQRAVDVGLMDAKWRQDPELASNLDTALSNQLNLLFSLDWDSNKDLVVQSERAVRTRLMVLHWLITNNLFRDPCIDCELDMKRMRMFALTQFDVERGEDRYAEALAAADEVVTGAKAVLASPESERHAVLARRIWFQTVQALGSDLGSFPSARTPEIQLARLNDTRQRQREFLAAFPRAWRIERLLGQTEGNRAKLLADMGEKREAIAAAESGAAGFDKASVQLLEDWYRTGSGPAERDLAKAESYRQLLASRGWGTHTFSAKATRAWVEGDETAKYKLVAEDQLEPGDDVVGRIVGQFRIEGMELSKAAHDIMLASLERAKQRNSRFLDQLWGDGGDVVLAGAELTETLRGHLATHDAVQIADAVVDKWGDGDGAPIVRSAIGQLLEDKPGPEYVPDFYKAALNLVANENYEPAEAVLTALLDRKDLPVDRMAEALGTRGEVRQQLKKFDAAEADRSLALVLKPDNAQILNSEAYVWATQDQHLPAAVKLLERAVQLDPKDPNIRDSLGWAYVKAGDTEKGLSLVRSASEERPALAEIFVHLADIYRRLAKTPEAQLALTHAAILPMGDEVKTLHQRIGKLLEDGASQPVLSEDAVLAMLAQIMATTDKRARAQYSTDDVGVAVRGYDVVSYFERGVPEQGSIRFAALWGDALWLFSSEEHRAAFKASPSKYIPTFGGFCPVHYADRQKVHGDPVIWALWHDKLYLFQDQASRTEWLERADELAKRADDAFDAIYNTTVPGDKDSEYSGRIASLEREAAK
jgi:tetratricopeptide (TPR) repeat protein